MVLFALTLTLGACEAGSPFAPTYLPTPGDGTTGTGTGGGGGTAGVLIVGTWQVTVLTTLPANDFITTKTTWTFKANLACQQIVESLQFSEGVTHISTQGCTYTLGQGVLLVTFAGAALPVGYPFSFPLNNPDQLILSDLTYERVS